VAPVWGWSSEIDIPPSNQPPPTAHRVIHSVINGIPPVSLEFSGNLSQNPTPVVSRRSQSDLLNHRREWSRRARPRKQAGRD
jgi:hypothetical protein